jgi:hypothetical protein
MTDDGRETGGTMSSGQREQGMVPVEDNDMLALFG